MLIIYIYVIPAVEFAFPILIYFIQGLIEQIDHSFH